MQDSTALPEAPPLNLKPIRQHQAKALTDLKRTKRLLLALRGLAEDRAEKSIVAAIHETTDRALEAVHDIGANLKKLEITSTGVQHGQ